MRSYHVTCFNGMRNFGRKSGEIKMCSSQSAVASTTLSDVWVRQRTSFLCSTNKSYLSQITYTYSTVDTTYQQQPQHNANNENNTNTQRSTVATVVTLVAHQWQVRTKSATYVWTYGACTRIQSRRLYYMSILHHTRILLLLDIIIINGR